MTLIQPTDIMLGRGPMCYNNPGNRMFRKVLKDHVVHYRNQALRREKAALVKMLVAKLKAKGFRFLLRSSTGTWVEAPPHIAENKVGHGLRDLRLSIANVGANANVIPKNFRPVLTAEQKYTDQVQPIDTGEAQTTEGMCSMKSDNTAAITTDVDPHCHRAPTQRQINANSLVSSPTNTPFGFTSELQEYTLADGGREKTELSSLAYVFVEASEYREIGGHVNPIFEQRAHGSLSSSGSEERSWNYTKDNLMLAPAVLPKTWATHHGHGLDSVGVALNVYAADYGRSIDNFFVSDLYQPKECDVEDAQSLCRWFRRNLS